jgi:hypothetical protein
MTETIQHQTVTVDGWTAHDIVDPPADTDGNVWIWQEIEGWFGGLDVRSGDVPRPLADGSHDGPAPFGGRTVTVSGSLVAATRSGLQRGMDRLAGVLASTEKRFDTLVVDETQRGVRRQALVRLSGPTMITRTSTYGAEWSLSFFAADPTRYGTVGQSLELLPYKAGGGRTYNLIPNRHYGATAQPGTGDVVNSGDTGTPLTVTFFGPCTNPGLRFVGGYGVQYLGTLTANDYVVIDSARRTVELNGANRRRLLSAESRWLFAPPGRTQVYFWVDNVNKTGKCSVAWRDAWS